MLAIIEILMMGGLFGFAMLTLVSRTNRWNRLYDHLKQQFGKRVSKPSLIRMLVSSTVQRHATSQLGITDCCRLKNVGYA